MTQDTNNQLRKYISLQRKVSSETQKPIITLGKALVQELGLEKECDTLGKWMAHFVAEQIVNAENAKGHSKSKAEKKCSDTILSLWSHRSILPNGRRPFEAFEPVFRALESFDPDNEYPRYFHRWESETDKTSDESNNQTDNVMGWIDFANGVDRAARVLIQYAFSQAAIHAVDEKTKAWINNAIKTIDSDEVSVILRVISARKDATEEDSEKQALQHHIESIKSKIEKLDAFEEACCAIKHSLNAELIRAATDSSKALTSDSNKPKKKRESRK